MGGSSKKPPKETTQTTEPWSVQTPYLKYQFEQAKQIYETQKPQYYPDQTYASISPETQQAQRLQIQRALAGSPVIDAAQQQATDTLSDKYLNANPSMAGLATLGYTDQYENSPAKSLLEYTASGQMATNNPFLNNAIKLASQPVYENMQEATKATSAQDTLGGGSRFNYAQAGREMMDTQASDIAGVMSNKIYGLERQNQLSAAGQLQSAYTSGIQNQIDALQALGTQWGNERARQMQTLLMAPGLAEQDYKDILALGDVGGQEEAYQQQQIDAAMQKWNFDQQLPAEWLGEYASLIAGNYGGSVTSNNPAYYNYQAPNKAASAGTGALSGAATGAIIGSVIPGVGTAIGAVVGGIIGGAAGYFGSG